MVLVLAGALSLAGCGREDATGPAPVTEPVIAAPEIGAWGFAADGMDLSVRPGDDFFAYANGGWLAQTVIPADRTGTGFSVQMRARNQERLDEIIDGLELSYPARGSEEQLIRDLYRSYLDEARIEIAGMTPFSPTLDQIAAAESHEEIAALIGLAEAGLSGPVQVTVGTDPKAPDRSVVFVRQSGLGLPDRIFYLGASAALETLREAYLDHLTGVLSELGKDAPAARAMDVLALEVELARLHWSRADKRDVTRTYNPMSLAALQAEAAGYPWQVFFEASGVGQPAQVIVRERSAVLGLADVFAQTPVTTWRDYLAVHYVRANARYMPRRFARPHFNFYRTRLRGQRRPRPRQAQAQTFVNDKLEHAVGRLYAEKFVTDDVRAQMQVLFANLKTAYGRRIAALDWMSEETKAAALAKLEAMQGELAYPDHYTGYDGVGIDAYDLYGNVRALRRHARKRSSERLEVGPDRRLWTSGPQTVNAFYSHTRNTVFVPAGYLQAPLFDAAADPALNYGAIGAIIGHEMGHGFDDRGAHYDADGRLVDWWSEADRAAFDARGQVLVEQFGAYEALPGMFVDGQQTLGENIADLAGMQVAFDAYILSLEGAPPPVIQGYSGVQRFFLGRAQARRYKRTEQTLRRRLLSDNHSPMVLRVNGILRNMDAWYDAFNVQPEDDLYLAPEVRAKVW